MIDVKDCLAQSSETKLWENIDCEDQNIQTQVKGVFHELPGIFFTKQWNKNNFPSHWSIFFDNKPIYKKSLHFHCSLCIFSMMVRWANDGVLQAYATKMLVNDGEMLINDGEMSLGSYTHFTMIDEHSTFINFTIILVPFSWNPR